MKGGIDRLKTRNNQLVVENRNLKKRVDVLENTTKIYNIAINGIPEEGEGEENIQNAEKIITEKLELNLDRGDIRDLYRIGREVEGRIRPLVIELLRYKKRISS
ncbi:hypothetical protein JTB14_020148 [Gonioctena quinquepunctata]|nr:hypothetical protein JTB14_020148 [Gonioctena quinquepunctata]